MNLLFLIFFLIIPLVELSLLFLLSTTIPLSSLFVMCGITACAGVWLLRTEDLSLWTLLETELQNNRLPTEELLGGILLLMGGIALLIPGILTDAFGLALMVPVIREWAVNHFHDYFKNKRVQ